MSQNPNSGGFFSGGTGETPTPEERAPTTSTSNPDAGGFFSGESGGEGLLGDVFLESLSFNDATGIITGTLNNGVTRTVDISAINSHISGISFNGTNRILTVQRSDGRSFTTEISRQANITLDELSEALQALINGKQDQLSAAQLAVLEGVEYTQTEKDKLAGIADGADVTPTDVARQQDVPVTRRDGAEEELVVGPTGSITLTLDTVMDGEDGISALGGRYNSATGEVTFSFSDPDEDFTTGDLRGADGAAGRNGRDGTDGAQGPQGQFEAFWQIRVTDGSTPAVPTAPATDPDNDGTEVPMGWTLGTPSGTGGVVWITSSIFNPRTGAYSAPSGVEQIGSATAGPAGPAGAQGAAGETGESVRLDIAYADGEPGESEIQATTYTGTRSNVVTTSDQNEMLRVSLLEDFGGGANQNEMVRIFLLEEFDGGTTAGAGGRATFRFDPDVLNTVYTGSIVGIPFNVDNANAEQALTYIGQTVNNALGSSGISWDGVVTSVGTPVTSRFIDIDLGTTTNIAPFFSITANSGTSTSPTVETTDGSVRATFAFDPDTADTVYASDPANAVFDLSGVTFPLSSTNVIRYSFCDGLESGTLSTRVDISAVATTITNRHSSVISAVADTVNNTITLSGTGYIDFFRTGTSVSDTSGDTDLPFTGTLGSAAPSISATTFNVDNATATQALTQMGTAIAALDEDITWDTVVNQVAAVNPRFTLDFSGATFPYTGGFRVSMIPAIGYQASITTVSIDWINAVGATYNTAQDFIDAIEMDLPDLNGVAISSTSFGTNTVQHTANYVVTDNGDDTVTIEIQPTSGFITLFADPGAYVGPDGMTVSEGVVGNPASRNIDIDLGTTTNIEASMTIVNNSGVATLPTLLATDGGPTTSGTHSTYTVTDYSSMEVTTFTGSVTDASMSDETTVLNEIVSAINDNTETPIDFMASVNTDTNVLTLTAQERGVVSGLWTITADHGTGTGDLAFPAFTREITGTGDTVTSFVYSSGTLEDGDYLQAVPDASSNYRAERLVTWSGTETEPDPSTTSSDYDFVRFVGENGISITGATLNVTDPTSSTLTFTRSNGESDIVLTNLDLQGPMGLQGDTGPRGAMGNTGDDGAPFTVRNVTVNTRAAGQSATFATAPTGTDGEYDITVGIPQGIQGMTGDRGTQGFQGSTEVFWYRVDSTTPSVPTAPSAPGTTIDSVPTGWTRSPGTVGDGERLYFVVVVWDPSADSGAGAFGTPSGVSEASGNRGPRGASGPAGAAGMDGDDGETPNEVSVMGSGDAVSFTFGFPTADDISTGTVDIRGPQGAAGADGVSATGGSYDGTTGQVTFTFSDSSQNFSTNDLRGSDGMDGARGPRGDDGISATGGTYDSSDGEVTFTFSDPSHNFSTGDLRGAQGARGEQGEQGRTGINARTGEVFSYLPLDGGDRTARVYQDPYTVALVEYVSNEFRITNQSLADGGETLPGSVYVYWDADRNSGWVLELLDNLSAGDRSATGRVTIIGQLGTFTSPLEDGMTSYSFSDAILYRAADVTANTIFRNDAGYITAADLPSDMDTTYTVGDTVSNGTTLGIDLTLDPMNNNQISGTVDATNAVLSWVSGNNYPVGTVVVYVTAGSLFLFRRENSAADNTDTTTPLLDDDWVDVTSHFQYRDTDARNAVVMDYVADAAYPESVFVRSPGTATTEGERLVYTRGAVAADTHDTFVEFLTLAQVDENPFGNNDTFAELFDFFEVESAFVETIGAIEVEFGPSVTAAIPDGTYVLNARTATGEHFVVQINDFSSGLTGGVHSITFTDAQSRVIVGERPDSSGSTASRQLSRVVFSTLAEYRRYSGGEAAILLDESGMPQFGQGFTAPNAGEAVRSLIGAQGIRTDEQVEALARDGVNFFTNSDEFLAEFQAQGANDNLMRLAISQAGVNTLRFSALGGTRTDNFDFTPPGTPEAARDAVNFMASMTGQSVTISGVGADDAVDSVTFSTGGTSPVHHPNANVTFTATPSSLEEGFTSTQTVTFSLRSNAVDGTVNGLTLTNLVPGDGDIEFTQVDNDVVVTVPVGRTAPITLNCTAEYTFTPTGGTATMHSVPESATVHIFQPWFYGFSSSVPTDLTTLVDAGRLRDETITTPATGTRGEFYIAVPTGTTAPSLSDGGLFLAVNAVTNTISGYDVYNVPEANVSTRLTVEV